MQNFVDESGASIPFCAGRDWAHPVPGKLGVFFATVAELIGKRGKQMAKALRKSVA